MAGFPLHPIKGLLQFFGYAKGSEPNVYWQGKPVSQTGGPPGPHFASDVYKWFQSEIKLAASRITRYKEFDMMDEQDILAAVLDLYTEDAVQYDPSTGMSVWVTAREKDLEDSLNRLFSDLDIDEKAPVIARGIAKYGDHFEALLQRVNEFGVPVGVAGLKTQSPFQVAHVIDKMGRTSGFATGETVTGQSLLPDSKNLSAPWDFLHFKLGSLDPEDPAHGRSLLLAARRTYRFLSLMEEAVVLFRLRRHPDRLKWKVDTGGMPPEEWANYARLFLQNIRKNQMVDPDTGEIRAEQNPMSMDEDILIPTGEGVSMDVENLPGSNQGGNILDLDYMRKKLFGCVRVPPDFMGFADTSGTLSQNTPLANQDIRYSRGVKKLQFCLLNGFVTLCELDLLMKGMDLSDPKNEFTVHMHPVTYLDELQRAETAKTRAETVSTMLEIGSNLKLDGRRWMAYVASMSGLPEELLVGIADLKDPEESKRRLAEAIMERLPRPWQSCLSSRQRPLRMAVYGGEDGHTPMVFGNRDGEPKSAPMNNLSEASEHFHKARPVLTEGSPAE